MVPIYFAFPNLKEWKNIPGEKYKDEYDLLNWLEFQFDREKNAFYPRLKVLPEHNLFKHFPTPIFGHIWVDDADFELLKKQKIYIYCGGMTVPAVMNLFFLTEVPKDGRKVKIIWDDKKIDEFALTEAWPITRDDGGFINSGLVMISNGVNILFLHPDFFSENILKNRISFTNSEREIPVLTEEIIINGNSISFRTVLRSDYRRKSFVRIERKIERKPITRAPYLIVGDYRISKNDLIVGFYSSPEVIRFSVHKVYHVDKKCILRYGTFTTMVYGTFLHHLRMYWKSLKRLRHVLQSL